MYNKICMKQKSKDFKMKQKNVKKKLIRFNQRKIEYIMIYKKNKISMNLS